MLSTEFSTAGRSCAQAHGLFHLAVSPLESKTTSVPLKDASVYSSRATIFNVNHSNKIPYQRFLSPSGNGLIGMSASVWYYEASGCVTLDTGAFEWVSLNAFT